MARYNKINLGPSVTPQVKEATASVDLKPGTLAVLSGGAFALATAATEGKVFLVQDNYLAMKGVNDPWKANSTCIGMELLEGQLYAARIANGTNVTDGDALTTGADGLVVVAGNNDYVFAYAEETYSNNTGEEQLIKIRPGHTFRTGA